MLGQLQFYTRKGWGKSARIICKLKYNANQDVIWHSRQKGACHLLSDRRIEYKPAWSTNWFVPDHKLVENIRWAPNFWNPFIDWQLEPTRFHFENGYQFLRTAPRWVCYLEFTKNIHQKKRKISKENFKHHDFIETLLTLVALTP